MAPATPLLRFAPSPTGLLHIGNARTALINFLWARATGGEFMLRMDDTDQERSKPEFADQIKADLKWLGLNWQRYMQQSDRIDRYDDVVANLREEGILYPCYETQQELDFKRKMQLGRGQPPLYDRAALLLTDAQKRQQEQAGRKPHWRFKLPEKSIEWKDHVRGDMRFEAKFLSDPILVREDGSYTYMLPSTVDDADTAVTHIVRGEDHISNTAIQILILESLGAPIPDFAHLSLIKAKDAKISKREGGFDIGAIRERGIDPLAILSLLATVGTSEPTDLKADIDTLIREFDINKFSKSQTTYDPAELDRLNNKLIHQMDYSQAKASLAALSLPECNEAFWLAVRANLDGLTDIKNWWDICEHPLRGDIAAEDQAFLQDIIPLLPAGQWNEQTWSEWTNAVKSQTGRSGKSLFMPIRKALTAQEHGPELKLMLPLIGREKVEKRLRGETA